jgi:hypothetical protein
MGYTKQCSILGVRDYTLSGILSESFTAYYGEFENSFKFNTPLNDINNAKGFAEELAYRISRVRDWVKECNLSCVDTYYSIPL